MEFFGGGRSRVSLKDWKVLLHETQKGKCMYCGVKTRIWRAVPEEAIDHVLEHYDSSVPAGPRPGSKPATIYKGKWYGRILRVYVENDSSPPRVKTVAWED